MFFRQSQPNGFSVSTAGADFIFADPINQRRRRDRGKAIALIGATLITVFVLVILRQVYSKPGLDTALCSREAPPRTHMTFLADFSDPWTPAQLRTFQQEIHKQAQSLAIGDRLSLLVLRPDHAGRIADPLFSKCKIRDGRNADPRIENPTKIQQQYREEYLAPLEAAIDRLGQPQPADQSPLLEAIHEIVNRPVFSAAIPHRVLVLATDSLQHSEVCSHFRKSCRFNALVQQGSLYVSDLAGLAGAEVRLYLLQNRYKHLQTAAQARFWEEYFTRARVRQYQTRRL